MQHSQRVQKPPSRPVPAETPTSSLLVGETTEAILCWTIPGYALYAAMVRTGDVPKKEQGHQAF